MTVKPEIFYSLVSNLLDKLNMKAYFSFILVFLISTQAISHETDCYDIHVSIQQHKVNEKNWDKGFGAKPDLKLCIIDSHGYRCFVDTTDYDNHKSICKNSLECAVGVKELPDESFKVEVFDIDSKFDDLIGRVECSRSSECLVGLSKVVFNPTSCENQQTDANNSMQPTADASAD